MAYLAELSSLTDDLVTLITSVASPDPKFNIFREASLRHLRHHSNLRTNQFDVQDQLNGWEERFRVHGREGLADALHTRLDALDAHSTRWTPDILHFLLQLSDQPTQKTELSDLTAKELEQEESGPKLTWAEIAKEDGWLTDRAIWQRIDYAGSSDDDGDGAYEETQSETSTESASTSPSSTDKYQRTVEDLVIREDAGAEFQKVLDSQAWRHADPPRAENGRLQKTPISDMQVLREVLFMLGGHPTTLFDLTGEPVLNYQLSNVSWDSFKALITTYAEWGRMLRPLREFSSAKQQIPLIQVFQDAIGKQLLGFDRQLSDIQARYVAPTEDAVVSLIQIMAELRPAFENLSALSSIVQQLVKGRYPHPFQYLELLFEAAGVAQSVGTSEVYRFLASIFFDCFQVYLRPIRLWMEDGRLVENDKTFFISQSPTKVSLKDIWNGQFRLRQTQAGLLHAPKFLHPAAKRIFTTGKSVNVLKHLGRYESAKKQWTGKEPRLDFATVCSEEMDLCPFPDLFSEAFDRWIQSKHHATSATLRQVLFESCNLSSALGSLQHIYFGSDGSALDGFAGPLFNHLDILSPSWKDRFTLTEIAQEAFSRHVDSYRLSAHVDPRGVGHSGIASRSSIRASLPAVRLTYRLNWPVQLILSEASIATYQSIFTFLLQLRRATSTLQRQWIARSSISSEHILQNYGFYCLIRAKLLWFCNALSTYLTSLVLAPNITTMKENLRTAIDVDDMIAVHTAFTTNTLEECCLGAKLTPLHQCILDILDLTIKLEDAHRAEIAKEMEEQQELSRLSVNASPSKRSRTAVYVKAEEEDGEDLDDILNRSVMGQKRTYGDTLRAIHDEFEKHLRFVSGGLRGVARATRSPAAGRWDILAEMLEVGISEAGKGVY
jgi:gamma-tubulin complex component 5